MEWFVFMVMGDAGWPSLIARKLLFGVSSHKRLSDRFGVRETWDDQMPVEVRLEEFGWVWKHLECPAEYYDLHAINDHRIWQVKSK